ncbi:MAG: hypothetical protein COB12_00140 [Flavobacterium sp.]|nr:MAG: hypothetical protein COB12_00140 [Flavobacterium sp.]
MNQSKYNLKVIIKTKEVTIKLHQRVAIIEISEGTSIGYENGIQTFKRLLSIIGDKPWVYISNRVNSYSLDPNDYKHLNEIPTLKGIGVIQYKRSIETALELEKMFVKKPFKTFDNLDTAIEWALKRIEG